VPSQSSALRATGRSFATIRVRPSTIHGFGVFAIADIAAGQNVGIYTGKRYPGVARPAWDGKVTYLFLLSDGTLIDGARGGNVTRHINHACRPNVEAVELRDRRDRLRLQIRAKRLIRSGEELVLDYALDISNDDPSDYPCKCGDRKCRGSLAGRQWPTGGARRSVASSNRTGHSLVIKARPIASLRCSPPESRVSECCSRSPRRGKIAREAERD
jgi:hypothetical protein